MRPPSPLPASRLPLPTWLGWALTCALLCPAVANAQAVALAGILGSKALLVVDGTAPRGVAAGDSHQGVKVVSVGREDAVLDIGGVRRTVRLGESPVSVGAQGGNHRVVLAGDSRGHFISQGQINGQAMQFMVDTGATTIAIGLPDAQRMGLNYRSGQPVRMNTANGVTQGWRLVLDSVRIGDVQVQGVEAIVTPQAMPYVLLGNNFLGQFQMTRNNDQMVLEKRH